ncbi:MAG: hypothetical protein A3G87_05190 [Omnitrophica bacterium RIFCSPLOWO2_12_FULL_50_11]|nr:MAG: hypothetical protein A3G87_05190 [Omnitrophica bacterium RIFCSPLOWO2_12_FULL_50_11]
MTRGTSNEDPVGRHPEASFASHPEPRRGEGSLAQDRLRAEGSRPQGRLGPEGSMRSFAEPVLSRRSAQDDGEGLRMTPREKRRNFPRGQLNLTKIVAAATVLVFASESSVAYGFPAFDLIPEAFAQVQSQSSRDHPKTVLLLLNAHTSSDAQRNIAETLKYLQAQGINLIGLEGADDEIDGKLFRRFPFKDSLAHAAWRMVEEGTFTGAEYFYITAEKLPEFYGIEDRDLYLENREAFTQTIRSAATLQPALEALRGAVGALKKKVYSKRLFDFDRMITLHSEGELSFMDYLEGLVRAAKEAKIALPDYSNVYALAKAIERDRKLRKREREKNLERIQSGLNPRKLFDELEVITKHIYERLITSEKEKTALEISIQFETLTKLLTIQLTYEQWTALARSGQTKTARLSPPQPHSKPASVILSPAFGGTKNPERDPSAMHGALPQDDGAFANASTPFKPGGPVVDVASMFSLIRTVLHERAPELSMSEIMSIEKAQASAVRFYELADKRNEVFTQKIIRAMEESEKDVSVVVVGGFHEAGLKEALGAEGISTVVISPKINDSASDIPYVDRMVGIPTHLEAIAGRLISAIDLGQKISGLTPIEVRQQAAVGLFLLSAIYEIKNSGPSVAQELIRNLDRAGHRAVPSVRMSIKSPIWNEVGFDLPIEVDGKEASLSVQENNTGSLKIDLAPTVVRDVVLDDEPPALRLSRRMLRFFLGPTSIGGFAAELIMAYRAEMRSNAEDEEGLTEQEREVVKKQKDKDVRKGLRKAVHASKAGNRGKFQSAARRIFGLQMTNDGLALLKGAAQRLGLDLSEAARVEAAEPEKAVEAVGNELFRQEAAEEKGSVSKI